MLACAIINTAWYAITLINRCERQAGVQSLLHKCCVHDTRRMPRSAGLLIVCESEYRFLALNH